MEGLMHYRTPSSRGSAGERFQRLACFLFAIVLRLEGIERRQRGLDINQNDSDAKDDHNDIRHDDERNDESTTSACPRTSVTSRESFKTHSRATSKKSSSSSSHHQSDSETLTHDRRGKSSSSPESSITDESPDMIQARTGDTVNLTTDIVNYESPDNRLKSPSAGAISPTSKSDIKTQGPNRPAVDAASAENVGKGGCCPCQIFFTPAAEFNLNPRLINGKWLMTPGDDGISNSDYFSTPELVPQKLIYEETGEMFKGTNTGKQDLLEMGDWKHLKKSLLAEASCLYRDALYKAHSMKVVEHGIQQALAKIIVKSVLDKTADIWYNELQVRTPKRFAVKCEAQKPRVQFDLIEEPEGKLERQRFVTPRESTPYRPAAKQRSPHTSVKFVKMLREESLKEDIIVDSQSCRSRVEDTTGAAYNAAKICDDMPSTPLPAEISPKAHQASPPVPFKLRTSKPMCNKLLRRIVEKHFGDVSVELDESDLDESITATGDAKKAAEKENTPTDDEPVLSTATTQTDDADAEERLTVNASIKTTETKANDEDTTLDVVFGQQHSRGMQTDFSLSEVKDLTCQAHSDVSESACDDGDDINEHNKRIQITDAQDSAEIQHQKAPVFPRLKTTIPQASELIRDAVQRNTSLLDSRDTSPERMEEVFRESTDSDYLQHAQNIVHNVTRSASAQYLAERAHQQAVEDRVSPPSGPFGARFDRNTPNVPDSAKETLNIATPESRDDDVAFRWSSSGFERAAASLVEPVRHDGRSKWTPYQDTQSSDPSRMSVAHEIDTDRMRSTDAGSTDRLDVFIREEDIYLSADSGTSDEEFLDAHSQSPEDSRQQDSGLMMEDDEVMELVRGANIHAVARTIAKDIIKRSLDFIDENGIDFTSNEVFKQRSQESCNEANEVSSSEYVTAAPSNDHAYVKIDVGGTRDSASTIETVTDSQGGESGFSDAQSSISDLQIITSEDDDEVIREIVTSIMKRAVNLVLDGTLTDWADRLEVEMTEDQAKRPDEQHSEGAESGISTTSSFHSASSDVTDITLQESEETAPTPTHGDLPSPAQEISMSCGFYNSHGTNNTEQLTEDADNDSMTPEDSLTQIAFFKNQLVDVKILAEQYQQKLGATDNTPTAAWADIADHDRPVVLSKSTSMQHSVLDRYIVPKHETELRKARSSEPMKGSKIEMQDVDNKVTESQNNEYQSRKTTDVADICLTRSNISINGSSDITQVSKADHFVPKSDETIVPVANVTLTSTRASPETKLGDHMKLQKKNSDKYLKMERKMSDKYMKLEKKNSDKYMKLEKKTSAGRVGKRRVKTHITFWEKIGKRRRASKNREQPVKPETPTKESIEKFEEIIAREAVSASGSEQEIAVGDVKKRTIRGRLSDKFHGSASSKGQLWKNSAFFAALKKSSKENVSRCQTKDNKDDSMAEGNTEDVGLELTTELSDHTPAVSEDQASSSRSNDSLCGSCKEESTPEIAPIADTLDTQLSQVTPKDAGIDALLQPSKSEEEIQLWIEKCKQIKGRTATLLTRCNDGEGLKDEKDTTSGMPLTSGGVPAITSDPSLIGSHDTGDGIFPFGVTLGGSQQADTFNIDAHLAALEQDDDWVASSDDMIATRVEIMMKESDETLRKIDLQTPPDDENGEQVEDGDDAEQESLTMMDNAIFESATDVQETTPSPAKEKKKKKRFRLFKLFRSRKSRKKDTDELDTRKESSQSCYSRASRDTYDDESYTVPDGKPMPPQIWDDSAMNLAEAADIWDDSAMNLAAAESGATLTNVSLGSSLGEPSPIEPSSSQSDSHDGPPGGRGHPKRSLRQRLFSFGGLKKPNKFKSSRHTMDKNNKS